MPLNNGRVHSWVFHHPCHERSDASLRIGDSTERDNEAGSTARPYSSSILVHHPRHRLDERPPASANRFQVAVGHLKKCRQLVTRLGRKRSPAS